MVSTICLAQDDPNQAFEYCPSLGAAITLSVCFGLITIIHIFLAAKHRKPFCWVLIMGAIWETSGYAIRSFNITRQADPNIYTAQFLLILLAPLWINAFIYMTLGRMIHFFLPAGGDRIFGVRARRVTKMFVWFDITAFLVQLAGGLMSSGTDIKTTKLGLKIYTSGVGLQLAFIAIFCGIAIQFQQVLKRQDVAQSRHLALQALEPHQNNYHRTPEGPETRYDGRTFTTAKPLLITIWLALSLIILRNVYRLIEYAMGGVNGNTITRHEWWMYVFDAVPMLAAMVVLTAYHPGRILQGERSDFSAEDKLKKQQKKAGRLEKKAEKQMRKEAKKAGKAGGKGYLGVKGRSTNESAEELV